MKKRLLKRGDTTIHQRVRRIPSLQKMPIYRQKQRPSPPSSEGYRYLNQTQRSWLNNLDLVPYLALHVIVTVFQHNHHVAQVDVVAQGGAGWLLRMAHAELVLSARDKALYYTVLAILSPLVRTHPRHVVASACRVWTLPACGPLEPQGGCTNRHELERPCAHRPRRLRGGLRSLLSLPSTEVAHGPRKRDGRWTLVRY